MSHNLVLVSTSGQEFDLVQTPTVITRMALAVAGNTGHAVATYERWLRVERLWADDDEDHAPGWSWDRVTRHVAMVNAFLAFAPGARFVD